MAELENKLQDLQRKVDQHNRKVAEDTARKKLLEQQKEKLIEELAQENVFSIADLENEIVTIQQQLEEGIKEVEKILN